MTTFRSFPYLYDETSPAARNISRQISSIENGAEALEILELANGIAHNTTAIIEHTARQARADGATWEQIGDALGMSKQGAQNRFGE